ncbi:hypothetical protein PV326_009794 [Microctonus aethiopoides]|nr:hypothetical protein PV326_009794 [Microctonus aethiopoides]
MAERSNASSTSSLALPSLQGASPDGSASPRRAVSPLLEVQIVEGVRRGGGSPLRPLIDEVAVEEEVATLMRRCWAQDSADRPDFPALKQTIRKINKMSVGQRVQGQESFGSFDGLVVRGAKGEEH